MSRTANLIVPRQQEMIKMCQHLCNMTQCKFRCNVTQCKFGGIVRFHTIRFNKCIFISVHYGDGILMEDDLATPYPSPECAK